MQEKSTRHLAYRADIDGLRAIAVIAVLLFHGKIPGFSGGFVGVDVFFVISGYLITSIIRSDQNKGSFTFLKFYERRARRILPSLLLVISATIGVSSLILLPSDLSWAAMSAVAAILFVSNIFFWRTGGYFSGVSEEKPLLHTWSLSVEEQFYIIFPVILILTFKFLKKKEWIAIYAIMVASLVAAVVGMQLNKSTPVFYMLPTRAWELMAGALLALNLVPRISDRWRNLAAIVGIALIMVPVAIYTSKTPFPGLYAIPPVLGAALIIQSGAGGSHRLFPLLAAKPMVWVGLISYSLYLWHWPILVLTRYYLVRELELWEAVVALGAAVLLAYASTKFIEKPFRNSSLKLPTLLGASALAGAGILAGCAVLISTNGLPERFPPEVARINAANGRLYKCPVTQYIPFGGFVACPFEGAAGAPASSSALPALVLWGDSHAQMYVPGVRSALPAGESALLVSVNGCPPLKDRSTTTGCLKINSGNASQIMASGAKFVVIALHWERYRDAALVHADGFEPAIGYDILLPALRRTISDLNAAGKKVVIVGPIPTPGHNMASALSRSVAFDRPVDFPLGVNRREFEREFEPVLRFLADVSDENVTTVLPHKRMCKSEVCSFVEEGVPAFADGNHLTAAYSESLTGVFSQSLGPAVEMITRPQSR